MQKIVTNQNFSNFNSVSNQEIENFFKSAIEEFKLVDFYYNGNHSTDVSKLSVLPMNLVKNGNSYQLEAVKLISGEFVMRRYNITGMNNINLNNLDVRNDSEWSLVEKEKDVLFSSGSNNQNAELTIKWNNWSKNMNINTQIDLNVNSNVNKVELGFLGFLPSHPENLIVHMENHPLVYANNETLITDNSIKLPRSLLIEVTVSTLQTVDNFRVGNKVEVNTDPKYFITKLSLTVIEINTNTGMLTCVGFNKKRELFKVELPANVMKTVFTKNQL